MREVWTCFYCKLDADTAVAVTAAALLAAAVIVRYGVHFGSSAPLKRAKEPQRLLLSACQWLIKTVERGHEISEFSVVVCQLLQVQRGHPKVPSGLDWLKNNPQTISWMALTNRLNQTFEQRRDRSYSYGMPS